MELHHTTENEIERVQLPPRVLMADAKATKKSLLQIIKRERPLVAIDMSHVEHIDSSGLAVLVNCLQTSRKRSGNVCLFGMSDSVKTLFELTRLHQVFLIEDGFNGARERLVS